MALAYHRFGMHTGMQTTIDAAGRVVIPKAMREHLGLQAQTVIDIDLAEDHVEIRPHGVMAYLVERQDTLVFSTNTAMTPLTDADVRQLIDEGRR